MSYESQQKILVLNDQGGGIMNCSYDVVSTLRSQTKHHEPVILIELTSTKNTIVTDEICPTLTSRMGTGGNQVNAVLITEET